MKKLILSAQLLTVFASNGFAQGTQTFQECRQAEQGLQWYMVTYTVAANGRRETTEAEPLNQACTAGDYERSRRIAAQYGDEWLPLQQNAAPVTPGRIVVLPVPGAVIVQRDAPVYIDLGERRGGHRGPDVDTTVHIDRSITSFNSGAQCLSPGCSVFHVTPGRNP